MSELYRVFVYGTLKRGEPNAHIMSNPKTGKSKFIGYATTQDAYPLFVAGQWNIPFLLNDEGNGYRIHGELYEVDKAKQDELDRFEGHPNVYVRTERKVIDEKNEVQSAWIYTLKRYDTRLDATKSKLIDKYFNCVEGRFYIRHEVVKSNDNLI